MRCSPRLVTDTGFTPLEVSTTAGPLADIIVLEIATVIAAPLATSLLADLGARVIKVEPITGDPYRHLLPNGELAVKTNAGKESICIDLKSEQGRDLLRKLVRRVDALVHNFRPGVPERLGFGYDQARELRPGIVWVALNGYGPDGPSARRPATHPVMGAAAGGAGYQAGAALGVHCKTLDEIREISRQLSQANEANPDPSSSVVGASAILLALLASRRHGIGQAVFVDMLTANAWANGDYFLQYEGKPPRSPVDPDLFGLEACYRLYAAKEGWVFLAVPGDRDFARFCAAVDRDDLARDPRFAGREARRQHDEALAAEIASLFQQRDADSWEKHLTERNVGCVRADGASVGEFFSAGPAHSRQRPGPRMPARALRRAASLGTADDRGRSSAELRTQPPRRRAHRRVAGRARSHRRGDRPAARGRRGRFGADPADSGDRMSHSGAGADAPGDLGKERLSFSTRCFYGLGSVSEGIKNTAFSAFLLFYYNQVLGLPGTLSGLAILLALVVDAVTDPLVGSISDNFHSRWGRRHPFMYIAALPMAVCFFLLFNPPASLGQTELFLLADQLRSPGAGIDDALHDPQQLDGRRDDASLRRADLVGQLPLLLRLGGWDHHVPAGPPRLPGRDAGIRGRALQRGRLRRLRPRRGPRDRRGDSDLRGRHPSADSHVSSPLPRRHRSRRAASSGSSARCSATAPI